MLYRHFLYNKHNHQKSRSRSPGVDSRRGLRGQPDRGLCSPAICSMFKGLQFEDKL